MESREILEKYLRMARKAAKTLGREDEHDGRVRVYFNLVLVRSGG